VDDPSGELKNQMKKAMKSDVHLNKNAGGMMFGKPYEREDNSINPNKPGKKAYQ